MRSVRTTILPHRSTLLRRETGGRGMRRMSRVRTGQFVVGFALVSVCMLVLAAGPATAQDGCSNAAFRTGPSANLPDCRAYEQVTPVEKHGSGVPTGGPIPFWLSPAVAEDGDRGTYYSTVGIADSPVSDADYLATRGASGWSSKGIVPLQSTATQWLQTICGWPGYAAYAPDLSKGILAVGTKSLSGGCPTNESLLVPDEPRGFQNLFLRDNDTGAYRLINVTPPGMTPADATFEGGTPEFSHVVFHESAQLTPDAPAVGAGLYVWAAESGAVTAVGLVPGGSEATCSGSACVPVRNAQLGSGLMDRGANVAHAVSADGSRVIFRAAPGTTQNLYLRELDTETTTQIDAAQDGPGPNGRGVYQTAAADGSAVFFTDRNRLTADASPAGADLYRYDTTTGELTDLTPSVDPDGAAVRGVVGSSDDASHIYFVADGVLAPNANSNGDTAVAGEPNLYLLHGSETTFIATLDPSADHANWHPASAACNSCAPGGFSGARVNADGIQIAFSSVRSLTGYDNADASTGIPDNQIFLYDAGADELVCVSCNPGGERPIGPSQVRGAKRMQPDPREWQSNFSLTRYLSADGDRLFFDSDDALLPRDTNNRRDVYQWQRSDSGGCTTEHPHFSEESGGCIDLISSGRGDSDSWFYDASRTGDDVFFVTAQPLVGQDSDAYRDLYDARVGGGLQSQAPSSRPLCQGDSCRDEPSLPPSGAGTGSAEFAGSGNLASRAADCTKPKRRAHRAQRKATRLRKRAKRADRPKRAKKLRARAQKQRKQVRSQRHKAKRCERKLASANSSSRGAGK